MPPPYPLAMVVCDAIWRDPSSGKRFLLGCFSVLHAGGFPARHPAMAVHVAVTNGHGRMPLTVRLIDDNEAQPPLWGATAEVHFPDPRGTVEMDFMMGPIVFPTAGIYRFQLFAGGEFVMERRIVVEDVGAAE